MSIELTVGSFSDLYLYCICSGLIRVFLFITGRIHRAHWVSSKASTLRTRSQVESRSKQKRAVRRPKCFTRKKWKKKRRKKNRSEMSQQRRFHILRRVRMTSTTRCMNVWNGRFYFFQFLIFYSFGLGKKLKWLLNTCCSFPHIF